MTAREFLDKYPEVEGVVEATVKDAKYRKLTGPAGVMLLKSRLEKELKLTIPDWLAKEFWIA